MKINSYSVLLVVVSILMAATMFISYGGQAGKVAADEYTETGQRN